MHGAGRHEASQWLFRRPVGAEVRGARLTLRLFIPDNADRDLGTMTLRAEINGHAPCGQKDSPIPAT